MSLTFETCAFQCYLLIGNDDGLSHLTCSGAGCPFSRNIGGSHGSRPTFNLPLPIVIDYTSSLGYFQKLNAYPILGIPYGESSRPVR
eukprot:5330028-Amphidinium_carterae.1